MTPEVLNGGFASGRLLASFSGNAHSTNEEQLTPHGQDHLAHILENGHYRVNVPEHGIHANPESK